MFSFAQLPQTDGVFWVCQEKIPLSAVRRQVYPDLRYERYLLLGLLFNTPGNALIGGGGGIAMLSGNSRQFSWKGFIVTAMISIAPVPVGLFLFGISGF